MPEKRSRPEHTVLSTRAIVLSAVLVLLVGLAVGVSLFWIYHPRDSRGAADILRAAGTIAGLVGGGAALLLAARRQQAVEKANRDLQDANDDTRHDAEERRINELQTSAGEQLGSDKAAVRLNGLYLLEWLGQPAKQQTVANVFCAYLRMPFTHPDQVTRQDETTDKDVGESPAPSEEIKKTREELQVRLTAQRILAGNLRPDIADDTGKPANKNFWSNINLDLSGAVLVNFSLAKCYVKDCRFSESRFLGGATFDGAHFERWADFDRTIFGEWADFDGARFEKSAEFVGAHFGGWADFVGTHFAERIDFGGAHFGKWTLFEGAHFGGRSVFDGAHFARWADFDRARFKEWADFVDVHLGGWADFVETHFAERARFDGAHFAERACFNGAYFGEWARFNGARFEKEGVFSLARFRWDGETGLGVWPPGWTVRSPDGDEDGRIEGKEGVWAISSRSRTSSHGTRRTKTTLVAARCPRRRDCI